MIPEPVRAKRRMATAKPKEKWPRATEIPDTRAPDVPLKDRAYSSKPKESTGGPAIAIKAGEKKSYLAQKDRLPLTPSLPYMSL